MGLEIDINDFLHNLCATKPPYNCPFEECNKTYKTYSGIAFHLCSNHSQSNGDSAATGDKKTRGTNAIRNRSPSESDYASSTAREALTYAEAQRMIEVEIDGRIHRININEPMPLIQIEPSNESDNHRITDSAQSSETVTPSAASSVPTTQPSSSTARTSKACKSGKKSTGKSKTLSNGKHQQQGKNLSQQVPPPLVEKVKLPEPSFRIVDDPVEVPDAEPRPAAYYRFIEKSPEELDESVEYDMDEEDCAWLELINSKRKSSGLCEVPPDTFELLMDRLEKESYFLAQNSTGTLAPAIDEDAVCCICSDGDCQNANAILFCDMCDLAVHQECYGVPYIPEGQWLCRRCLHSPSAPVDCVLCPNKGGAFKQTEKGDWAHVVCAIWIPEVCFANTVFLEPIDSIENIPTARWKLTCYICKQRSVGACIQCHKPNCYTAFHVTCAQSAGLFMKIDIDNKNSTPSSTSIRKAAYCHTHAPAHTGDGESSSNNSSALTGVYSSDNIKDKIRKTRKILAEKRSATPNVAVPTIPPERLTAIAEKITFPKRNSFIQRLLGYWTLKRQSRNGVPLLRRLLTSYIGNRRSEPDSDQAKKWREELKYWQRLRQDLEKARLLVELIRKREKLKTQLIEATSSMLGVYLQPFNKFLCHVLDAMEAKDKDGFFVAPVDTKEVHDYLEFIANPMDFSTMRKKIRASEYASFKAFEDDFKLIVDNCRSYNDSGTVYFKAANKLADACKSILEEARGKIKVIGYNEAGGIHWPPLTVEGERGCHEFTANAPGYGSGNTSGGFASLASSTLTLDLLSIVASAGSVATSTAAKTASTVPSTVPSLTSSSASSAHAAPCATAAGSDGAAAAVSCATGVTCAAQGERKGDSFTSRREELTCRLNQLAEQEKKLLQQKSGGSRTQKLRHIQSQVDDVNRQLRSLACRSSPSPSTVQQSTNAPGHKLECDEGEVERKQDELLRAGGGRKRSASGAESASAKRPRRSRIQQQQPQSEEKCSSVESPTLDRVTNFDSSSSTGHRTSSSTVTGASTATTAADVPLRHSDLVWAKGWPAFVVEPSKPTLAIVGRAPEDVLKRTRPNAHLVALLDPLKSWYVAHILLKRLTACPRSLILLFILSLSLFLSYSLTLSLTRSLLSRSFLSPPAHSLN